jgi:GNAT superfamily N-acetyltransferase
VRRVVTFRRAGPEDLPFLLRILAVAADWRAGVEPRAPAEVLASPELAHYLPDWEDEGDRGVVAHDPSSGDTGAAWWHYFDAAAPGYGFVAEDVPEVTVGVLTEHRGRGVGTRLLHELISTARTEGLAGLSLSVEPDNFAIGIYAGAGFVPVGVNEGSVTMLLSLRDARCCSRSCRG